MEKLSFTKLQTNALLVAALTTDTALFSLYLGVNELAAGLAGALAASLDKFSEASNGDSTNH